MAIKIVISTLTLAYIMLVVVIHKFERPIVAITKAAIEMNINK